MNGLRFFRLPILKLANRLIGVVSGELCCNIDPMRHCRGTSPGQINAPWWISLAACARALVSNSGLHFPIVNNALEALKLPTVDDGGMRAIGKAVGNGDLLRALTPIERAACRVAARKICDAHKKDPGKELLMRFPVA